jgi:pyridoxine/pyridoxamine 5'-phosphate oxidase
VTKIKDSRNEGIRRISSSVEKEKFIERCRQSLVGSQVSIPSAKIPKSKIRLHKKEKISKSKELESPQIEHQSPKVISEYDSEEES